MAVKKGTLSIDSENIFPIIKKWVYSDHDIFVRELVSNGCDAITKLKKLDMMGEYELPEGYKPKIEVIVNPEEKTMKFIDNGLGMTAEEVEEYITQIAFSGATQFLEKYKDKTDTVVEHITEEPKEGEEGEPKQKAKIVRRPVSISDTHPLWTKNPSECTKDDYIDFYRKVFMDYKEPLFWIHLNMDYPFNLKGILYFPKINTEYDSIEGKIKLYNNQVFIADNIKEVIPEFLMVLKGVIDCPDLPLNVSRSALQNDGFVNKVADYISKKVADKLNGMFKTDRENRRRRV